MNPSLDKTASLVPEFYYDLIARIVPGLISSVCISLAWQGDLHTPQTLLESLILLIICYVLGLSMDRMGHLIISRGKHRKNFQSVLDGMARVEKPQNFNVLVKIYAELVLFHSLFNLFFSLSIFGLLTKIFKDWPQHLSDYTFVIFLITIFLYILSTHSLAYMEQRLQTIQSAEKPIFLNLKSSVQRKNG